MSDASQLDQVAPMTVDAGTAQQPLVVGASARLPSLWQHTATADAHTTEDTAEPPVITSIAALEALADVNVVPPRDDLAFEASALDDAAPFDAPAIVCDLSRAPVLTRAAHHTRIAQDCADRLAGLGEHRALWPIGAKADTERRMLAQVDALVCIGGSAIASLAEWWDSVPTPWASWAYVFSLACIEGREALEAIAEHVRGLGPVQRTHRRLAAEAFATSENPHAITLARACMRQPGCEAFAIELLSLEQLIAAPDLRAWLARPEPEIRATVMRALARLESRPTDVGALEALLDTSDVDQAWEVARALTLWGSGAPLSALRHGSALFDVLGERAVEIFVLSGHLDDAELMQRLVRRVDMTPTLLDAIARFGHAGTWAFLAHFLGDAALDGAAAQALRTVFGDIVSVDDERDPFAWEPAIATLSIDASQRYRRGQPWSPRIVAQECADEALSRRDIEHRLDELHARARIRVTAPLWACTARHTSFTTNLVNATRTAGEHR